MEVLLGMVASGRQCGLWGLVGEQFSAKCCGLALLSVVDMDQERRERCSQIKVCNTVENHCLSKQDGLGG